MRLACSTYSECVFVALVIQHAKCITLSHVACLAVPHFPTLSNKQNDFWGGKVTEQKMCFFIFSINFCLEHFSFQEELNDTLLYTYTQLYLRNLSFLSDFNGTYLHKTLSNFTNICSVAAKLFHGDRQTDMTKPVVAFQFC